MSENKPQLALTIEYFFNKFLKFAHEKNLKANILIIFSLMSVNFIAYIDSISRDLIFLIDGSSIIRYFFIFGSIYTLVLGFASASLLLIKGRFTENFDKLSEKDFVLIKHLLVAIVTAVIFCGAAGVLSALVLVLLTYLLHNIREIFKGNINRLFSEKFILGYVPKNYILLLLLSSISLGMAKGKTTIENDNMNITTSKGSSKQALVAYTSNGYIFFHKDNKEASFIPWENIAFIKIDNK